MGMSSPVTPGIQTFLEKIADSLWEIRMRCFQHVRMDQVLSNPCTVEELPPRLKLIFLPEIDGLR